MGGSDHEVLLKPITANSYGFAILLRSDSAQPRVAHDGKAERRPERVGAMRAERKVRCCRAAAKAQHLADARGAEDMRCRRRQAGQPRLPRAAGGRCEAFGRTCAVPWAVNACRDGPARRHHAVEQVAPRRMNQ